MSKAGEVNKIKQTTKPKEARSGFPKKQGWRVFWWIVLLIVWVFAAVVVSQLVVALIMHPILGERLNQPVWTAIYEVISYLGALGLTILVPPRLAREQLGLKGLPTWTDIGLAPIGFIVSAIGAMALVWLFSLIPWFNAEEVQDIGYSYYMSGGERALAFIMLVVVAPVIEEVIFRGWLYGKLRARLGMIVSILITSVLFGLVHLQWNVGVNVFALSVVCCGLREVTGTIYAGILTHMIKNGVAFYLVYVMGL